MNYKSTELLTLYLDQVPLLKVERLAAADRRILFEYNPGFVASGLQISPFTLPVRLGVATGDASVFDGLFGVFNDSLPDCWGRLLLDRAVEKRGINRGRLTPLDRLTHVGRSGMGALIYEPDQGRDDGSTSVIHLDSIASEAAAVLAGAHDDVVEKLHKLSGASSCARPKVVAQVSGDKTRIIHGPTTLSKGYSHWIIKFPTANDAPDAGATEFANSQMAHAAGLAMPEAHLFGGKKKKYFGIKRFDRDGERRIHMHSLSGLIGADHRVPSLDYDTLLKVTLALTKDVREAEKAFSIACFNVLAHNRDDHAKNISFLMSSSGQWALAPAYDLTISYGPGGEQSMMVIGEGKSPAVADLRALAKKHGLKNADALISRVQDAVSRWRTFATDAGVTQKSASAIERAISAIAKSGAPAAKATKSRKKRH